MQGSGCTPYSLGNWFDQRAQLMAQGQSSSQAPEISFAPNGPMNNRPSFWNYDYRDFGPRVGAAWSPSASGGLLGELFGNKGDFVIRGGYSLMYDHFGAATVNTYDANGSYGLTSQVSNVPDAVNVATAPRFTGIYNIPAGLLPPPPTGGFPAMPSPSGFAITWGMDGNLKTPYTHDLDLSIGRQLTNNSSLEVSYIGTFGRRLLMQEDMAMPADLVDPKSKMDYFTAVNLLTAQARAGVSAQNVAPIAYWQDMFPALAGEDIGFGPNTSATQVAYNVFSENLYNETSGLFALDLPDSETGAGLNVPGHSYPAYRYYDNQYSSLYAWRSIGQSSYDGLQVVYRRRMSQGLQADFNYTYSKSMDWASGAERIPTSGGNNYAQIINSWAPGQLRGVSDFDVTHQINSNWIWLMPYGRGRHFGEHSNAVLDAIFGGWQLASLVRWTTGFPMIVDNGSTWPTNWNIEGFGTLSGNIPASALGQGPGPNAFRNPGAVFGAFRQAYPGESGTRNPLRGDGFFDLDTGLDKYFSLGGDRKLEFRWETFNAPNSVRFDVMTVGNRLDDLAAFGKYTSELTDPRVMQFALRVDF